MMKSVTMVAWDAAPVRGDGGLAHAVGRLANQLSALGVETRILLPAWLARTKFASASPLCHPIPVKLPDAVRHASRWRQHAEFCRAAHASFERLTDHGSSDAIVVHSDESALFALRQRRKRNSPPLVFWIHSLFDPPIDDLPHEDRRLLSSKSVMPSAINAADIVVTSAGVMKDAREFEWPTGMRELQQALLLAETDGRLLTVESIGCLPERSKVPPAPVTSSPSLVELDGTPYVLFPARPSVDKGLALFAAIAEGLRSDHIDCVAIRRPSWNTRLEEPYSGLPLRWLPWLAQDELLLAMRGAACTVLPSITEGFGLATAESVYHGITTLYQPIGGQHVLKFFPNARPVSLTTDDRARLYRVWVDLSTNSTDRWTAWSRHEQSLRPLIEEWVQTIRATVLEGQQPLEPHERCPEPAAEHRWGDRLMRCLEARLPVNEPSQ
jgi:glycosyltransferase involved in cell wall biosynthesis